MWFWKYCWYLFKREGFIKFWEYNWTFWTLSKDGELVCYYCESEPERYEIPIPTWLYTIVMALVKRRLLPFHFDEEKKVEG